MTFEKWFCDEDFESNNSIHLFSENYTEREAGHFERNGDSSVRSAYHLAF